MKHKMHINCLYLIFLSCIYHQLCSSSDGSFSNMWFELSRSIVLALLPSLIFNLSVVEAVAISRDYLSVDFTILYSPTQSTHPDFRNADHIY